MLVILYDFLDFVLVLSTQQRLFFFVFLRLSKSRYDSHAKAQADKLKDEKAKAEDVSAQMEDVDASFFGITEDD